MLSNKIENERLAIKNLMEQSGINNPSDELINWVSEKFTTGLWSEPFVADQIEILSDPTLEANLDTELDNFIEVLINSYSNDRLKTVSQNEMFQFNFPSDFMNCKTIYWSDGDHFSASGEEYFGQRVTQELLLNE